MFHPTPDLRRKPAGSSLSIWRRLSLGLLILGTLGGLAAPLHAQTLLPLDETCTVVAGNRTALVRSDGTFLIDNLGIFRFRLGLVDAAAPVLYRVRATCLRNGQMEVGQSAPFAPVGSRTTFTGPIYAAESLAPVPARIEVSAGDDFVTLNGTTQLTVTAHFADGTTRDITARAEGTTFLSMNPQLLTVSPNGQVTGENRSLFLQAGSIAVLNEGNLATFDLLSVGPSNDFDNDGLPNDYEERFGLDRFRDDSLEDPDNDGLTNLQEFQLGTLPNNPDTDLDGVIDGEDGDPLRPESEPPTLTLDSPVDGATLYSGANLTLRAVPLDDGRIASVELFGNGTNLGTLTAAPWEITFSVPFGTPGIVFSARVTDGVGNVADSPTVGVSVQSDPGTTVVGTVVDTAGVPIADADVELILSGLVGEFYDFATPLDTFPDLGGLTPAGARFTAALGYLNPNQSLSPDTFGFGFDPDFAGRFRGRFRSEFDGELAIRLGADDGARVSIDDTPVVEVPGNSGSFATAEATVPVVAGEHNLSVEYFQSTAASELTLSLSESDTGGGGDFGGFAIVIGPGAGPSAVEIRPPGGTFVTTTGPDGTFSIPVVPTISGFLAVDVATPVSAGVSDAVIPVPGGITELGTIVLVNPDQICLNARLALRAPGCNNEPPPPGTSILVSGDDGTDPTLPLITFEPDEVGAFCADLPRRRRYFFDLASFVTCTGQVVTCRATLDFGDQNTLAATAAFPPAGSCSTGGCLELETVTMNCTFFGGS